MQRLLIGLCSITLALGACGPSGNQPASTNQPAPTNQPAAPASSERPAARGSAESADHRVPPTPTPVVRRVTVPAGTELTLKLRTRVGSAINQAGDPIVATVAAPVLVNGTPAIPEQATVAGTVVTARPSGRVKGRASIGLEFRQISVGDRAYPITVAPVSRTAAATHKKDTLEIGVPAAAGTLIGALTGGKKGALIGGAVAGGAGTAYVLATPGQDVLLPAGTTIRVKLLDPLTVQIH